MDFGGASNCSGPVLAPFMEVLLNWTTKSQFIFSQSDLRATAVRPGAVHASIVKHIGWHTFRHSFATLLKANGEDVTVAPESLRHANSRI
jgi:site-specific recombinase XerD